jgi:hypothetical protein
MISSHEYAYDLKPMMPLIRRPLGQPLTFSTLRAVLITCSWLFVSSSIISAELGTPSTFLIDQ